MTLPMTDAERFANYRDLASRRASPTTEDTMPQHQTGLAGGSTQRVEAAETDAERLYRLKVEWGRHQPISEGDHPWLLSLAMKALTAPVLTTACGGPSPLSEAPYAPRTVPAQAVGGLESMADASEARDRAELAALEKAANGGN